MKIPRPVLAAAVMCAVASPAGADTWQAVMRPVPSSPASCPRPTEVFEFSTAGGRLEAITPTGKPLAGAIGPNGAVEVNADRGVIVGNALSKELEVVSASRPECRYALVPWQPPTVAGADWAIGRWNGHIVALGGAGGAQVSSMNSTPRSLLITKVAEGRYTCRWSFPETVSGHYAKACRIGADDIALVTSADSDVKLTRTGTDALVGTFVGKQGANAVSNTKVHLNRTAR